MVKQLPPWPDSMCNTPATLILFAGLTDGARNTVGTYNLTVAAKIKRGAKLNMDKLDLRDTSQFVFNGTVNCENIREGEILCGGLKFEVIQAEIARNPDGTAHSTKLYCN